MKEYHFGKIVILIFALILLASGKSILQKQTWKLEVNKNGVKVYTRKTRNSAIMEFKATVDVTSSISKLEELLERVDEYPHWQSGISTSTLLKILNEREHYIYYTSDVPWPVNDRDIVLYSNKLWNADTVTYNLYSKPDYITAKEGYVRIRKAQGSWRFYRLNKNMVNVTFQFYADPGGNIPDWIINMFIVDGPYNSLINLRKKVEN